MAEPIAALNVDEVTTPLPPRCWWLKRLAAAVGVLLLATVGLRLWWGHVAEQRLAACLAAYRAAGEPVEIEDLAVPPVPDEENGALYLQRAARRIRKPAELTQQEYQHVCGDEYWPASADALRLVVRANAEALALVRRARGQTRADWGYQLTSPLINTSVGNPDLAHRVTKLALAAARCAHADGDDDAAVAYLRDVLGVARHMQALEPFGSAHWSHCITLQGVVNEVRRFAFELRVRRDSEPAAPGAAALVDVRMLIAELLDEQALRETWLREACGERLLALDYARLMSSPSGIASILRPAFGGGKAAVFKAEALAIGPAHKLDVVATMEAWTRVARAGLAADYQTARTQLGSMKWEEAAPAWTLGIFRYSDRLGTYADLRGHFRVLARRRLAATALAVRLYEQDHGVRPAELGNLVPDYLPAVPLDPFDPHPAPLRYSPDHQPPVVYSVGQNGRDDGGDSGSPNTVAGDEVFLLDKLPPPRPRPWPPRF